MSDVPAGWEALSRGRWEEALRLFEGAEEDPEALEGVGLAHWWLDDADATFVAREQAYRLYRARKDAEGAARVASALAWDSVLFGGRTAVARGWLQRAARLLADLPASPEHAWLAVREAEVALSSGEPETAREAAARAVEIGATVRRDDVQVVGRSLEGLALVQEGRVDDGMRRLDESAAAATAGDIDDLMWVSKVCCYLISACETVGDVDRATQWCDEVKEFAQRWELRTLFNVCRTQYAAVLVQRGTWREAEGELSAALEAFRASRRAALVEGTAQLGELRRRQGRLEEARSLFAQSELHPVARLGAAELALDDGDALTAFGLAQRLERGTDASRRLARVPILNLMVRAATAAGRLPAARAAASELVGLSAVVDTPVARASAEHAAGVLAVAHGDSDAARRHLEDTVDLYGLVKAPYERARARLLLGRVLADLGLAELARAEADAARSAFAELGARRDASAASALLESFRSGGSRGPLTRREQEVIRLVAAGRSNREIASQLVVSEHTVHRHVSNILRKLGEPTRAAAAARAARDGLV